MTQIFVQPDVCADNAEEVIRILSESLYEADMVKEGFAEAVVERERNYPTGLPTAEMAIAIPHADPNYVIRGALSVAKLKQPVIFQQMGEPEKEIAVNLVILMAVSDPTSQLPMISNVINMFSNSEIIENIKHSDDPKQLYQIFQRSINNQSADL